MKTTLHIGTTKTGSKSIQTFLSTNRDVLAGQGVLFPESLGKTNHLGATVYAGGPAETTPGRHGDLSRQLDIKTPEDYATFCENLPQNLAREIAETQPDHIIFSNEHMHSRFRTVVEFDRLKVLLASALEGREVQIVVYLRPQVEHVISLYSTMLRHGYAETVETFIESWITRPASPYFNFKALLDLWGNAFGRESLRVRAFSAMKSLDHGVVTDFASLMQIDTTSVEVKFPHVANMSMGARAATIIQSMNGQTPKMPYYVRRALLSWVRFDVRGGKIHPDVEVLRRFEALHHGGNQQVIDEWMPDHPHAFDVSWDQFDNPAKEPEISTDTVLRLVEKLNPSFNF